MRHDRRLTIDIPVIETARLVLRGHRLGDFDDEFAMWSDPAVTRFIGDPSTEQQAWVRFLGYSGHWAMLGYGGWAIEEKSSGGFVGAVGVMNFRRDIAASMKGFPEIGWVLSSRAHGKGYATEAARAALAWTDENLRAARTVCLIDEQNLASLRVAEKCGYREFARSRFADRPAVFLERTAADG